MTKFHTIVLLAFMIFSAASLAEAKILEGDVNLTVLEGKVTKVESLCPEDTSCFINGTSVHINFDLKGCADRLGPVAYKAVHADNGNVYIFISAFNMHNIQSKDAKCAARPVADYKIDLVDRFYSPEQIQIHYLGTKE